ncbi:hypothetical protein SEA_EASTWEST_19 [Arthrobacter phage EastWest]|uniref:Uncharacterized protein n=1 Tax=Arthrobacter phage EastWest TaxID=2894292 RepID=A0AAE9C9P6_9CAUD|nr:hypothetical protein SEA_EASTWEST_19 [Arthrobacter phage EastWest]
MAFGRVFGVQAVRARSREARHRPSAAALRDRPECERGSDCSCSRAARRRRACQEKSQSTK